jgi:diguanylate cyclase (GGDEF)-like protein
MRKWQQGVGPLEHVPAGVEDGRPQAGKVSLRLSLYLLVLFSLMPAFLLLAYLARSNYLLQKEQVYSESTLLARKISARLDREFTAIESGLKVLATSEHLASGNLRKFHQQAREAVRSQIVYNYILTDEQGRQLLNTLRPFGSPLPATGTPPELAAVFREGRTVLADLFTGPVVGRPVIAMGVPVRVDDRVRYSLNIGLDPQALNAILRNERVPPSWLLVILDSSATIVARTRNTEQFIGQKAVPEVVERMMNSPESSFETRTKEGLRAISTHHRSSVWSWIVAVGVGQEELERELRRDLNRLLLGGGLTLLLGLAAALVLSRRLVRSLQELNSAARDIAQGRMVTPPAGRLTELEDIGYALHRASLALMDVRHRAYHDALTGLANRDLFLEMAVNQLGRARREQTGLAVLAIDLDNFKPVNDTHGHALGDRLLQEVALRLSSSIRDCDLAARVGGDEFLVLVAPADARFAQEVAQRLIDALSAPYEGTKIRVSASIGMALYPDHGENVDLLVRRADDALYQAKRAGRQRAVLWSA